MTTLWVGVMSFGMGAISLLFYLIWRMMRNDDWDDSNITNALRLLSHVTLHPHDFGSMWYIDVNRRPYKRPFWYVSDDELSEVVDGRP